VTPTASARFYGKLSDNPPNRESGRRQKFGKPRSRRKNFFALPIPLILHESAKEFLGKAWRKMPLIWKNLAKKLGDRRRLAA
jgi:hypothetical protein